MNPSSRPRASTAGLLVTVALTGALLAFGRNDGELMRSFRLTGRMLLQSPGRLEPSLAPVFTIAMGFVHHAVMAYVWGALLFIAVRYLDSWKRALASLVVSFVFCMVNLLFLPPLFGLGYAAVTSVGRVIPFAFAFAFALLVTPWASRVSEVRSGSAYTA